MGCCQSTDRGDEQAVDREGHAENNRAPPARNLTYASSALPASTLPSIAGTNALSPQISRGGAEGTPAHLSHVLTSAARPNVPIRAPSPLHSSPAHIAHQPPPWTRAQLAHERDAFFDTRVSGNREVWAALKVAAETLRRVGYERRGGHAGGDSGDYIGRDIGATTDTAGAEMDGGGNDDALITAQALLDALNLTCPGGRVASGRGRDRIQGGIYDERGALYELPAWIVQDPDDLLPDETDSHDEKGILAGLEEGNTSPSANESGEAEKSPTARRRSDFKGKGRAEDFGERIAVRARLSDRARDVVVHIGERQPVSALVSAVRAQIGLEPESGEDEYQGYSSKKDIPRVRLVYLGKLLDLRRSMAENGWQSTHVVNAFVYLPEDTQGSK